MEEVPADPTTLPGFEHHTFLCSACNRSERRLLFIGAKTKWTRAVEKLVRKQKALKEEQTLASKAPTNRQRLKSPAAAYGLPSRRDHPTARTPDLIGEFNRIWDDPRPDTAAEKPPEPQPMSSRPERRLRAPTNSIQGKIRGIGGLRRATQTSI
jgi:hypothetical protein